MESGSSSLKVDDEKKPYDSVELAYGTNELDPELNSVKEVSVYDQQQEVSNTADVIDFKNEIEENNVVQSEKLVVHENEQSELVERDNITEPINEDLPEINGEFCQQADPSSSNEENEIKNDVAEPEQAQLNIDFKPEENSVDIQQESDMPVLPNDDEVGIKEAQVLDDKNDENINKNTQAESSIQQSSNLPTIIEISQYQQPRTFCSTSSDSKEEDRVGKKPKKDVGFLIKRFEQMGTIKKLKK
ncbi:hypothetical protein HCN44_004981 [Aphidius gifuensis]|uniref:Uncharacterized protein n=1 Tax=Aphidius gifuensis TaxID=684658 RepID=A0A834XUA7_APHGI|nr:hypothetical protein HCN44_004981 [Aphidius gifuensis]